MGYISDDLTIKDVRGRIKISSKDVKTIQNSFFFLAAKNTLIDGRTTCYTSDRSTKLKTSCDVTLLGTCLLFESSLEKDGNPLYVVRFIKRLTDYYNHTKEERLPDSHIDEKTRFILEKQRMIGRTALFYPMSGDFGVELTLKEQAKKIEKVDKTPLEDLLCQGNEALEYLTGNNMDDTKQLSLKRL